MNDPRPLAVVSEIAADFPREEFGALVRRLPRYGRLALSLAGDSRLSRIRRAAVLAAAGYVISPIDAIPGIIPVVGQLDDLLVALAAIRLALDGLKPEWRAEKLAAAGLSQDDLDADMRTTGHIAVWIGRSGLRLGESVATGVLRTGNELRRRLIDTGRRWSDRGAD